MFRRIVVPSSSRSCSFLELSGHEDEGTVIFRSTGYLFTCRHSVTSQKNLHQHRYEKPKSGCVWHFADYLCLTCLKVTEPCPVTLWRHWRCCVVCCVGFKRGGGWQWLSPGETSTRQRQLFLATFTYRFFSFAFTPYCIFFFGGHKMCFRLLLNRALPCFWRSKSKDLCIQSRNFIFKVFQSVKRDTKYVGLNRRCCQVTGT